ncbi:MAG: hypothetical protein ABEI98_06030 [Halorhabdus sp.]
MSTDPPFQPQCRSVQAPPGLRLVDPIDGGQFTLLTDDPVGYQECSTDSLPVPVDKACALDANVVSTPYRVGVWIRDESFDLLRQYANNANGSFSADTYVVELSSVQLKVYLGVEGAFSVRTSDNQVSFSFPDATDVTVGVRSFHDQPARTITTTDDIDDVMTALSQFRAALKTTSPERSFPTLRGYPPLLERGDTLSIPGGPIGREPSVTIEIPPRWDRVLPVAPLAYYLDADVRPGGTPRIRAHGTSISLAGPDGYEARIWDVLRHVFTLDCLTRTEGLYDIDLHERSVIADRTTLDFEALYEQSLEERTVAYLDVPFDVVDSVAPKWKLTADIQPEADYVPVLPFLAADLAYVRTATDDDIKSRLLTDADQEVKTFFRGQSVLTRGGTTASRSGTTESPLTTRVFRPVPSDSLTHTFIGDGIPMGATKMTTAGFERRLDHEPVEPGRIQIDVVNNEAAMSEESVVSDVYGTREWIDFDVTVHTELDRAELADTLGSETDFLHYVGHVEADGFRCRDGHLDARSLTRVGVDAFLLNACNSYEQGRALVDSGALGGIVTLANVPNPTATRIGKTLARLLNAGFSLATARSLLAEDERLASRYMVVGDGHAHLAKPQSDSPYAVEIQSTSAETVTFDIRSYPLADLSIGGVRNWHTDAIDGTYVNPTVIDGVTMTNDEFSAFLTRESFPVFDAGELRWSDDVVADRR